MSHQLTLSKIKHKISMGLKSIKIDLIESFPKTQKLVQGIEKYNNKHKATIYSNKYTKDTLIY